MGEYTEKLETIAGAIEVCQLELNEWETDFLNDIYLNDSFSNKQKAVIDKLFDRIG